VQLANNRRVDRLRRSLPARWRALPHELAKFGTIGLNGVTRLLPKRWQSVSHEIAKFGAIGVINLLVNFAVFNLLWFTFFRNGQLWAKGVATIVATTCAYFMNRHWTYRDRPKSTLRREYSMFFFFNAVGLVIEVAVVGVAKYGFGQTHIVVLNLCTGVGIVLGTIFRFWAYRTHVFKLDTAPEEAAEPAVVAAAAAVANAPDPAAMGDAIQVIDVTGLIDAPDDLVLHDELTQLELDGIVAHEHQTSTRSRT
jgi:putative flippase GtrA